MPEIPEIPAPTALGKRRRANAETGSANCANCANPFFGLLCGSDNGEAPPKWVAEIAEIAEIAETIARSPGTASPAARLRRMPGRLRPAGRRDAAERPLSTRSLPGLVPRPEPGEPPQAVLLTTSGGVTDGDTLKMAIEVGPGGEAVAATQAAEKIYRAAKAGGHCAMDDRRHAWARARSLDWLPQETIVFEGARLKRRTVADVAPGGSLLACEMVVLGRAASGERFTVWPAARFLVGAPPAGQSRSPGPIRCASRARRRRRGFRRRPMRWPP